MGLGIVATTLLGAHSSFLDLMPASALIGAGGGFTVPLSALDINTMPGEKASLATAIFSATREVAGLLGIIIIIGVVLSTRQNVQLHAGATQTLAYLSGYRWALVAAAIVVVASGAIAFFGLPKVRGADHTNDTTVMARYTESQLTPVSF
jgi:MFS family permease